MAAGSIREDEPPRQNITKRSPQSSTTVLTSGFRAFIRPWPCVEFSIDAPA